MRWSPTLDRFLLSLSLQSVVIMRGSSPMTDTRNRQDVGEGICFRIPEKSNGAPSHEQLLENQVQLLKLELSQEVEHCINEFGARKLVVSRRASD